MKWRINQNHVLRHRSTVAAIIYVDSREIAAGIDKEPNIDGGTALRIAKEVKSGSDGKLDPPVAASRVGSEFGLHTLFFDSPDDLVELSHRARGREGFARGAVFAAERVRGRKGLITFDELVFG